MRIKGLYMGTDCHHNHMLENVSGDWRKKQSWAWINGQRSNFPEGVPVGAYVQFIASPHFDKHGRMNITDVREFKRIS